MSRWFSLSRIVLILTLIAVAGSWAASPGALAQDATPDTATPAADCPELSRDEKVALARQWHEIAISEGNLEALDDFVAEDVVFYPGPYGRQESRDELKAAFEHLLRAFPDLANSVEHVVAEGEYVVTHWRAEGTHNDEYIGIPATGESVSFSGINVYRFSCGEIVEGWSEIDALGIRAQLESEASGPATPAVTVDVASASPMADCEPGDRESNLELGQRWLDVWNAQDVSTFDEIAHPDIAVHSGHGWNAMSLESVKEQMPHYFTGFPDFEVTLEEPIVEGDWVVIRWVSTGTHTGQFFELEPTGVEAIWSGINLFHIECGQIVEVWSVLDALGLRQQLSDGTATPAP